MAAYDDYLRRWTDREPEPVEDELRATLAAPPLARAGGSDERDAIGLGILVWSAALERFSIAAARIAAGRGVDLEVREWLALALAGEAFSQIHAVTDVPLIRLLQAELASIALLPSAFVAALDRTVDRLGDRVVQERDRIETVALARGLSAVAAAARSPRPRHLAIEGLPPPQWRALAMAMEAGKDTRRELAAVCEVRRAMVSGGHMDVSHPPSALLPYECILALASARRRGTAFRDPKDPFWRPEWAEVWEIRERPLVLDEPWRSAIGWLERAVPEAPSFFPRVEERTPYR